MNYDAIKQEILTRFGVMPSEQFDPSSACRQRIDYLKTFLRSNGRKGYVLGISGGVDSSTAGRLCQIACNELRNEGYDAYFHAVRLPAGVQRDEEDAQIALRFIRPDFIHTVNIGEAANILNTECVSAVAKQGTTLTPEQEDYHKGNIKARLRMTSQYHLAAVYESLVMGTAHAGEDVTAFHSKWADNATDVTVLNRMNKKQIRMCCEYMGAPTSVWAKAPTADLEELNPGKLDDVGFGFPYDALDDFLEGKPVAADIEKKIIEKYTTTHHKRDAVPGYEGIG